MSDAARRRRLSGGQARLWFLQRLNASSSLYNEHACVRVSGRLNRPALHQALALVVRRHESLRWIVTSERGECVAWARDQPAEGWLQTIDLTGIADPAERERGYRQAATAAVRQPFNLETGPLFRVLLCDLSASELAMIVMMHHIISDARSMQILVDDWSGAYRALTVGRPDAAPAVDYRDSPETLADDDEADLAYWIDRLADAPTPVSLPTHRGRPAVRTFAGAKQYFVLDEGVTAAVKGRAREEHATPFICLLALWNAYLGTVAGSRDLIVGTTTDGRRGQAAERQIGFFVNTVAIRTALTPGQSFRQYLRHVRAVVLDALARPHASFDRVVQALRMPRVPNRQPLFEVMFIYVNAAVRDLVLPGVTARLVPDDVASGLCKFDLVVAFSEGAGSIHGLLDYSVELYAPREIAAHVARFRRFVDAALADPDRTPGALVPVDAAPTVLVDDLSPTAVARELPSFEAD